MDVPLYDETSNLIQKTGLRCREYNKRQPHDVVVANCWYELLRLADSLVAANCEQSVMAHLSAVSGIRNSPNDASSCAGSLPRRNINGCAVL